MTRTLLLLCAASLASTLSFTQEPTCATSESGFVDGVPCFAFGGRMYASRPGDGVEAGMIRGAIALDQLAQTVTPMTVVPVSVRSGRSSRTIDLQIDDPPVHSLILFRTPTTKPDGNFVVRLSTASGARDLHDAAGKRVIWSALRANEWLLVVRDEHWQLIR